MAFAGSLRADSFNKKILNIAVRGAKEAGAEVTFIDLSEYPLPVLSQDDEAKFGIPLNAMKLKKLFKEADGFLIASPEYNSSISGVLKNTIDWVSRPHPEEKVYLECFIGKTAAIISASPGALGGLRGLVHLRAILGNINVMVIPEQVSVPGPDLVFDDKGNLKEQKKQDSLVSIGKNLTDVLRKLKGYPA